MQVQAIQVYCFADWFPHFPWILRANQYKWHTCIIHTVFFPTSSLTLALTNTCTRIDSTQIYSLSHASHSRSLSLSLSNFVVSTTHTNNAIWTSHQHGWIWDIDNMYGMCDGVRETGVTRLLWRVPTTAIALSDWNGVLERVWNITKSPSLVYISPKLIQTQRCNRE